MTGAKVMCVLLLLLLALPVGLLLCWCTEKRHIFGQAPPTMLIYANCTATIKAQYRTMNFFLSYPSMPEWHEGPHPACSVFKHHSFPSVILCPCPCFLSHFHSLMAPLFLDVPYIKFKASSHQSVSWTPCLASSLSNVGGVSGFCPLSSSLVPVDCLSQLLPGCLHITVFSLLRSSLPALKFIESFLKKDIWDVVFFLNSLTYLL